MADQNKITLRSGHATPRTIILRELPVATSVPLKIYLRQLHASASTIVLRNTTTGDAAGGPVAGTANQTLGAITQAAVGTLPVSGTANQTLGAITQAATGVVSGGEEPAEPVVVPFVSTGGGGAWAGRWYRGKYQGELRRAINDARRELASTPDGRKKKKVAKRIAARLSKAFVFVPPETIAVPVDLVPLELLRIEILRVSVECRIVYDQKMSDLIDAYYAASRRIDEREEEQAIALVLALAV